MSKFIFFHADSGNGLKHNFEAVFEAKSEKKMRSLEANGGIFFHADSGNDLKHNFEAVLSFKSLFEKVPEGLQGSDFV